MTAASVNVSKRGKSLAVPALEVNGHTVVVTGRWLKIAFIHDEDWMEEDLRDPESCVNRLKERNSEGLRADIFTVAQRLPDVTPRYAYPMEWESLAVIRLSTYEAWWANGLSGDARKDVRRAVKRGVITRVTPFDDDLVRGIVEIHNESPIRQGKPFWHYQKDFDTVKREHATYLERSVFIGAYYRDELIGFMKIVSVGNVAGMMQILSKSKHHDKRPANALIAKAVEYCAEKGMSYLTYGHYRNRNKIVSSLGRFKHRVGFEEVPIPRFYVPLTTKGRIGVALGLHRDLVEALPEWLVDFVYRRRAIRGRWRRRASGYGDPDREG